MVETDGKQALVQGGFVFPFPDDLLVSAAPLFGSKELTAEAAVSAAVAGGCLFVVVGPWRVWLLVDRDGRFPDVHAAVPRATAMFDRRPGSSVGPPQVHPNPLFFSAH